ncbi:hypothetical protein D9M70_527880 [compost metagenome]
MAGVQRLQLRQLLGVLLDLVRQLEQQPPALGGATPRPGWKGAPGGGHGEVDIGRLGGGDAGDQRAVGGRQHVDGAAGLGGDELAVDEQLVLHGKSSPGAAGSSGSGGMDWKHGEAFIPSPPGRGLGRPA